MLETARDVAQWVAANGTSLAQALRRHWKGFLTETSPERAVLWLQQRLLDDPPPPLDDKFGKYDW